MTKWECDMCSAKCRMEMLPPAEPEVCPRMKEMVSYWKRVKEEEKTEEKQCSSCKHELLTIVELPCRVCVGLDRWETRDDDQELEDDRDCDTCRYLNVDCRDYPCLDCDVMSNWEPEGASGTLAGLSKQIDNMHDRITSIETILAILGVGGTCRV